MKQLILLSLTLISISTPSSMSKHTILNTKDLYKGIPFDHITSFEPFRDNVTRFWFCTQDAEALNFSCIDWDQDEFGNDLAMLDISLQLNNKSHEFAPRHAIYKSECQCHIEKIQHLLDQTKELCLLGESGSSLFDSIDDIEMVWVYIGLKTFSGEVTEHDGCP